MRESIFWATALGIIVLDQASKYFAGTAGIPISYNTGISFGFLSGISPHVVTFFLCVVLVFLFFFAHKELRVLQGLQRSSKAQPELQFQHNLATTQLALGLFFGGALSNVLDRIVFLAVRDWLSVPFLGIHNNLADWAIFLGIGVLLVSVLRQNRV